MKTYKQQSIVSGKSISDILNMDIGTFNKLDISDMRKVVGRLVSAGNKRIRNFEKSGQTSPALRQVRQSGGAFSTKGKNLNQLRNEFMRAKGFIENKSSTVTGWKKIKKQTVENLRKQGVNVTTENLDSVLRAYEKLKEVDPSISSKAFKYRVMGEIASQPERMDIEERILEMQERLDDIYEEGMKLDDEYSVSDFFEM